MSYEDFFKMSGSGQKSGRTRIIDYNFHGNCECLADGKWHPKFTFSYTIEVCFIKGRNDSRAHEWRLHGQDMIDAYSKARDDLFNIETDYESFGFSEWGSCMDFIKKVKKLICFQILTAIKNSKLLHDLDVDTGNVKFSSQF